MQKRVFVHLASEMPVRDEPIGSLFAQVNMLAREYCDLCKPKRKFKPVILSHKMMPGLKQGQEKMSKSDPDSAIFMEDSEQDVRTKVTCLRAATDADPSPV